jgi:hypothetical protein
LDDLNNWNKTTETSSFDATRAERFDIIKLEGATLNDIVHDLSNSSFLEFAVATNRSIIDVNIASSLRAQERTSGNHAVVSRNNIEMVPERSAHEEQDGASPGLKIKMGSVEGTNNTWDNRSSVPVSCYRAPSRPMRSDARWMSKLRRERRQAVERKERSECCGRGQVTTMSAHPTLSLYVAGTSDGHVGLWSFEGGTNTEMTSVAASGEANGNKGKNICLFEYSVGGGRRMRGRGGEEGGGGGSRGGSASIASGNQASPSSTTGGRKKLFGMHDSDVKRSHRLGLSDVTIHRVRYNATGDKFGAVDSSGLLRLWSSSVAEPFCSLVCNSRASTDLTFLDGSTTVLTAGLGTKMSMCIWDTLLPSNSSLVSVVSVPDSGGVTALLSIPDRSMLVAGTTNGQLLSYDVRALDRGDTMMFAGSTHHSAVTSLSYCAGTGAVATASKDGVMHTWAKATKGWQKQTLSGTGRGVMWWSNVSLLSWGSEGKLVLHTSGGGQ